MPNRKKKTDDLGNQPPSFEPSAAKKETDDNIDNKIVPTPVPEIKPNEAVSPAVAAIQPMSADEPSSPEPSAAKDDKIIPTPVPEIKPNEAVSPAAAVVEPISAGEQPPPVEPSADQTDKIAPAPVPETKPDTPLSNQVAVTPETDSANTDDAVKTLDDKRRELLIGKKVAKRIETENGVLIVEKNGVVTEEVLQKATLTNKLKELYINILK